MNWETRGQFFSVGFPSVAKVSGEQESEVSPKKNGSHLITTAASQRRITKINQSGVIKWEGKKALIKDKFNIKILFMFNLPNEPLKEITTFSPTKKCENIMSPSIHWASYDKGQDTDISSSSLCQCQSTEQNGVLKYWLWIIIDWAPETYALCLCLRGLVCRGVM